MDDLLGYGEIIYKKGQNKKFRLILSEKGYLFVYSEHIIRPIYGYFYVWDTFSHLNMLIDEDRDMDPLYYILSIYEYDTNVDHVLYQEIIPITDNLKNKVIQQFISYFSLHTKQPELIYFFDQIWKLLGV